MSAHVDKRSPSRERRYVSSQEGNGAQPVALLDVLVERHGPRAIVTVHPYQPGGEILRWELLIDGEEVPEADIRLIERNGRTVMLITNGTEEIELTSWREDPRGRGAPASIVDTLGAVQRRSLRA
jgi:hypothetical protein